MSVAGTPTSLRVLDLFVSRTLTSGCPGGIFSDCTARLFDESLCRAWAESVAIAAGVVLGIYVAEATVVAVVAPAARARASYLLTGLLTLGADRGGTGARF
jgi:hypothetical protein